MREQYCNMYEKEPVIQVSKSIKNLQDWFEKKEEEIDQQINLTKNNNGM